MTRLQFAPRVRLRAPLFFAAVCLIATLGASMNVYAGDTGIRGKVVWGPVKPGPSKPGQVDEVPLSASFTVIGADDSVATFNSDRMGSFEISLPPGEYTIVPNKNTPIPFPESQKTHVSVTADTFVEVTIRLETGMK